MLYGREVELERVRGLIERSRDGGSGALALTGEPGGGKSALLDAAADRADGMRVLRATGLEAERSMPFGLIHELLRPELGRARELPERQAQALEAAFGTTAAPEPSERFLAGLAALGVLAEASPVLCLVDDLQWADEASAESLAFIAKRLRADGVGLLVAVRFEAAEDLVGTSIPRLDVGPLDVDSCRLLLADRSGGSVAPHVGRLLYEHTGGNPLALTELAAQLTTTQLSGESELPAPLPLGASIERAYASELRGLPEQTRSALLVAALAGDSGLAPILKAVEKLAGSERDFAPAEERGLISIVGDRVRFKHPLVRAAAHAIGPLHARRAAHRALAESLDDPERRAWQRAAATVGPEPGAAAELERAAENARRRGARLTAAAARPRAAELDSRSEERLRLLAQAAWDAWSGGDGERAAVLVGRVPEQQPAEQQLAPRLNHLRGAIEVWRGNLELGCRLLTEEAERIDEHDPCQALELLAEAVGAASLGGELALAGRTAATAERLRSWDREAGPALLRESLQGIQLFAAGDIGAARPHLREVIALAEGSDDPVALDWGARAAIYLADEERSVELDRRAAQLARERGAAGPLARILARIALGQVRLGRLRSAVAGAEEASDLARATGQHHLAVSAGAVLAYALAERGASEPCQAAATATIELAEEYELPAFREIALAAMGHLRLSEGQPTGALALLSADVSPAILLPLLVDLAEAAAQAGDEEARARAAAAASEWHAADGSGLSAALAHHCAAVTGPEDRAPARLEAALKAHELIDRPFEHARAELALGRLLRRQRQPSEAASRLESALARFEEIGAETWAERTAEEARACGLAPRRREPSTRDQLTPQERQVSDLVAQGLRNKEVAARLFISVRTVEFHLGNVYRKLGLSSRTQLATTWIGSED